MKKIFAILIFMLFLANISMVNAGILKSAHIPNPSDNHNATINPNTGNSHIVAPNDQDKAEYQNGYRDGLLKGKNDGRNKGLQQGRIDGQRAGEREGKNEGIRVGKKKGEEDGKRDGRREGLRKGRQDGNWDGSLKGERDGKKRCYNEGHQTGYSEGYAQGYDNGINSDAYQTGYDNGAQYAYNTESEKGHNAGYKDGFAQQEKYFHDSFYNNNSSINYRLSNSILLSKGINLELKSIREAQSPSERDKYQEGYNAGYSAGYNSTYSKAYQNGYNQTYQNAYNRAYNNNYQLGYDRGYRNGKDRGYRATYHQAYDNAYNISYNDAYNREYYNERTKGYNDGFLEGKNSGYNTAYNKKYDEGYKKGYDDTAATVYPEAYAKGKEQGISECNSYYHSNAVLEMINVSIMDENKDGVYQTGEKFQIHVKIANFGFVNSLVPTLSLESSNSDININSSIRLKAIKSRKYIEMTFDAGRVKLDAGMNVYTNISINLNYKGNNVGYETVSIKLTNYNSKRYKTLLRAVGWLTIAKEKANSLNLILPEEINRADNYIKSATDVQNLDTNSKVLSIANIAVNHLENIKKSAPTQIRFAIESCMWTLERSLE